MVDLIYGRGITDLVREMPFYFNIFTGTLAYRLFHIKKPMYGSVDVNNVCNLHCTHCYWWLNRKLEDEISAEKWREVARDVFRKNHIFEITLVGGEPLLARQLRYLGREGVERVVVNASHLSEQIEEFCSELEGVKSVESSMVFSPPWTPDKMSEDAKFVGLDAYKQAIVAAASDQTVYTNCFDIGWPYAMSRVLRNSTFEMWETAGNPAAPNRPGEGGITFRKGDESFIRYCDTPPTVGAEGDLLAGCLYAGTSVDGITSVRPAAEIVSSLWAEAQSLL